MMLASKKAKLIGTMADYFAEKGQVMSRFDYLKQNDTPIRYSLIRRYVGSWARLIRLIEVNFPEQYNKASNGAPVEPKEVTAPKEQAPSINPAAAALAAALKKRDEADDEE